VQEDFKRILQQRYSLEQFAEWIFHLATRFLMVRCLATQWHRVRALTRSNLANTQGTDMMQVMNCAQQLLLRWSYFHNFIMTDITTRKGPGLGKASLHLHHIFTSVKQSHANVLHAVSLLQRLSARCACSWKST
jgi:hypothetical protein